MTNTQLPELLILVGAPGAGKTTFAQNLLKQNSNYVRVNRDDIRKMIKDSYTVDEQGENLVSSIQTASIKAALDAGRSVVVDNTHCSAKYVNELIGKYHRSAYVSIKFIGADLTLKQLIGRNDTREKKVPEGVIEKMYKNFNTLLKGRKAIDDYIKQVYTDSTPKFVNDKKLPKCIIVDIDGTVASMAGIRGPHEYHKVGKDAPIESVLNVVRCLSHFYKIVFMSGRIDSCRQETLDWLDVYYQEGPHELYMRKTGDSRKDSIIKPEIFLANVADKYYTEAVLDDRTQVIDAWRKELGLKAFQVDYGDF